MKVIRILSALLTLSLLLSCICVFASAQSEVYEGLYNGYRYYCYGQVTKSKCYVEMQYGNSTPAITMSGSYSYLNIKDDSCSKSYYIRGKTNTMVTNAPADLKEFVSLNAEYYIGTTRVVHIPLSA